ncbi:MAG: ABC transporter ATP-binding protein [Actinomycetota bacterium]
MSVAAPSAPATPTLDERGLFRRGMRQIATYLRMHPRPFWLSVAGAFTFAIGSVGVTVALGRATDRIIRPALAGGVDAGTVWRGVGLLLVFATLRSAGIGFRRYYSGVLGSAVAATLREKVSDRYRDLALAYHRSTPTGELLAHMEADVEAAVDVIHPVPFAIGITFLVVFAMVSLFAADPYLALIGLFMVPTLGLMNRAFARRMEGPAQRSQERLGEVSSVAHESIDGALVVKALGREHHEVERLGEKAERLRDERVAAGTVRADFEPALETLPAATIAILIAVGAWRVSEGSITLGTLVQVVTLFNMLAWPMRFVGWILSELPRAVVGYGRITAVLDEPITLAPPTEGARLPVGPLGVRAEAVSYAIGGTRILDEATFEVAPGESVALVGPTGVGKSTLAQLLVRLDDPTGGEILLGGVNLRHADVGDLRAAAAIVFQDSFLFAASVTENIALGDAMPREAVERAATVAQADRFIRNLPHGYDTVVGERGHTLSGGERQRVALARALVRRPRLLILDDATSAVDPTIEAEILAGLRRELDTTLVVVAYRLSTIRLADRVLYLEKGRIRATGRHDDLMASEPGYAAMVRAYERGER